MAKLTLKSLILAALALTFFPFAAQAQNRCVSLSCQQEQLDRKPLTQSEILSLPEDVRGSLQNRAERLANIWSDTILEGDYWADDIVEMIQVEELFRNSELVGYRITYSSKAWDTSSCEFDSDDLTTLNACETGLIIESGFVTADFRRFERDPKALARFLPEVR
jgi:hypothetical protein